MNALQDKLELFKQLYESSGENNGKYKSSIRRVKRKIWSLKGIRDYSLSKADLRTVIKKLKKVGQVPEGYHYPELNRREGEAPQEIKDMLQRKRLHQMLNKC